MTEPFETYSFKIHTNMELELMLAGRKPMAIFCRGVRENIDETNGQPFQKYVSAGSINRTVFYITNSSQKFKIIYFAYTLPGEEWRVQLYKKLKKIAQTTKWCKDMEIIEGTLLGYAIEENLEHVNSRYGSR
jgi:hypothetical protein